MSDTPEGVDPLVLAAFEHMGAVLRMAVGRAAQAKEDILAAGFSPDVADQVGGQLLALILERVLTS